MKKILLQLAISCFGCNLLVSNVLASNESDNIENNNLEQVYLQNEYIIDQLELLSRANKKVPHRIGAELENVDMPLLVIKLNSLNFLMKRKAYPDMLLTYKPYDKKIELTSEGLLQQSQEMLQYLPQIFDGYQQTSPIGYKKGSTLSWFAPKINNSNLHKQFLRIESLLYGLKNIITPKDVYEIVRSTGDMLVSHCMSQNKTLSTPLVMGKRPKDVYFHIYKYLNSLSQYAKFVQPERGPIHILPHDVFDIVLIALVYSRELIEDEVLITVSDVDKMDDFFRSSKQPDIITPSHVFQAVDENIKLLGCLSHAS